MVSQPAEVFLQSSGDFVGKNVETTSSHTRKDIEVHAGLVDEGLPVESEIPDTLKSSLCLGVPDLDSESRTLEAEPGSSIANVFPTFESY